MTMRPSSREKFDSADETAQIIQVARLHYELGQTQEEIAEALGITQPTVSRRLKQAHDKHIVKTTVCAPPIQDLQSELLAILRDKRKKLRDLKVVPRGAGGIHKGNVDNLGVFGAEFLEEIILHHDSDQLKIAMACGHTVLALLLRFMDRVEQSKAVIKKLRQKEITLYPLNLFWGWTYDGNAAMYPSALVIHTAIRLDRLGMKVRAYTPPPLNCYDKVTLNANGEDTQQQYDNYIHDAEGADIFLLGIGTADKDASNYRDVVSKLHLEDILIKEKIANEDIAGEINYQPFTTKGTFVPIAKFPGVQAKRLQEIAQTEKKVILVAGGAQKAFSVLTILRKNAPFNILLTDEDIAEQIRWV